jgi:hypothetical protein
LLIASGSASSPRVETALSGAGWKHRLESVSTRQMIDQNFQGSPPGA